MTQYDNPDDAVRYGRMLRDIHGAWSEHCTAHGIEPPSRPRDSLLAAGLTWLLDYRQAQQPPSRPPWVVEH